MAMAEEPSFQCGSCNLMGTYTDIISHTCPLPSSEAESETSQQQPQSATFSWNESATRLLLTLYEARKNKFGNSHFKKRTLWEEICEAMREKGYHLVRSQIENKFKSLITLYRKAKDHNRKSGNGPKSSPFYQEIDGMFSDSPVITPISGMSSLSMFTPPTSNEDEHPTTPPAASYCTPARKGRKRKADDLPEWFKEFSKQLQQNHQERVEVNKELIGVLKGMANKQ